ncbi:hypothetical protein BH24ACT24_BH24ACT24_00870 [soil metagenome]
MPRHPDPPTVAAAARRAADTVDPGGEDADVGAFVAHLEDDDEPVTAVAGLSDRLEEARRAADPEGDVPAVTMAAAVADYLAYRREGTSEGRRICSAWPPEPSSRAVAHPRRSRTGCVTRAWRPEAPARPFP